MRRAPLYALLAACGGTAGPGGAPELDADTGAGGVCSAWTYDGEATSWTLPAGGGGAFARAERAEADCAAGLPATRLVDLTGDGRLDLVALTDCADATVGRSTWRVWPGVDGGFGEEVAWSLPLDFGAGAFAELSRDAATCDDGDDLPAFFLADLDGDARDDLVITASCADPTLEAGTWRVHANTGAGFGEAVGRTIPYEADSGAFVAPRGTVTCEAGADVPAWSLLDLDGDGAEDLVVTDTCMEAWVGVFEWTVLRGGPEGFAERVSWPIPDLGANAIGETNNGCPAPAYMLVDLEGDARPDLVVPRTCSQTGTDWSVHPNRGDGFSPIGEARAGALYLNVFVSVPEQAAPDCSRGSPAWVVDDATGDGFADITMTASCMDPAVGDTRWDLHAGSRDGWTTRAPVALPAGYSADAFAGSAGDEPGCGGTANRPAWTRADLDGDGLPELVVTEACDDDAVGVGTWRVHTMRCEGG